MIVGRLDRRVQFRRMALIDDRLQSREVFKDHGTPISAKKTDVSDGERVRAMQVQATITARFVVRWSPFTVDLTPKDRLVCEDIEYDITGIKELGDRRSFLEITAAARADT
ncbi:MAG: head-tail adaptor protein [Tabrizicola sp.]|nr:head-tail adaptor protein [Tabrizicola sp.]